MKTAISIDEGLLREADHAARRMGVSRSRLFARAVGEFLAREQRQEMLVRLNDVYGSEQPADRKLLPLIKAKTRRTLKDRW
jgi:hypothetical protein